MNNIVKLADIIFSVMDNLTNSFVYIQREQHNLLRVKDIESQYCIQQFGQGKFLHLFDDNNR